jgi:hypothetical protein
MVCSWLECAIHGSRKSGDGLLRARRPREDDVKTREAMHKHAGRKPTPESYRCEGTITIRSSLALPYLHRAAHSRVDYNAHRQAESRATIDSH